MAERCEVWCRDCYEDRAKPKAALDAAEARAREAEEAATQTAEEARHWRRNYMTVADAVAAASTSAEHLAGLARATREQRDAAQARVRRLEAALRHCDKKLSDANAAHPSFYVLDALNIIDAALADGADKGE